VEWRQQAVVSGLEQAQHFSWQKTALQLIASYNQALAY
jgi:hypothetical protein